MAHSSLDLKPTPVAELVLIALKGSRDAPALIDAGRQLASRLGARWGIVHIETLAATRSPRREQHDFLETLRAAEALGGHAVSIAADHVAAAIAGYARTILATHLVIGAPRRRQSLLGRVARRRSVSNEVCAELEGVCVQFVGRTAPLRSRPWFDPRSYEKRAHEKRAHEKPAPAWSYSLSLCFVLMATGLAAMLSRCVPEAGLSVVFLTAVLLAATELGMGPAMFASVLSLLSYDFFFLEPIYSLSIGSMADVTAFMTFAVAAVIASRLATRVREQVYLARRRAAEASDLYQLTRGLAGAATAEQVAQVVAERASAAVERPVAVLLADAGSLSAVALEPREASFSADDLAASLACLEQRVHVAEGAGQTASVSGPAASKSGWRFLPMRAEGGIVAVVGVLEPRHPLELEKEYRLTIIAEQVAIAIDRINLVTDLDRERQRDATDRLHAALLASISHDLRDPLTAILGSAVMLDERWRTLPGSVCAELIRTVRDEAERLELLVHNLLDMARLQGTAFRARLTPTSVSDVVGTALRRTAALVGDLDLRLDIAPDLPLLMVDPVLFEQVLFNLIDNASKHAPVGSTIRLSAYATDDGVDIRLADEGPGFWPEDIPLVFDKFFHGRSPVLGSSPGQGPARTTVRRRNGAGLGLAICRGFVEAMHGSITAANRTDRRGAVILVSFPTSVQAPRQLISQFDEC